MAAERGFLAGKKRDNTGVLSAMEHLGELLCTCLKAIVLVSSAPSIIVHPPSVFFLHISFCLE